MDFKEYQALLEPLLNIDSPSGYYVNVIPYLKEFAINNKIEYTITKKNSIIYHLSNSNSNEKVGLCAHVDTLGLMINNINDQGLLQVSLIGGPNVASIDGEYVKIYTRDNNVYYGTVMYHKQAVHVYQDSDKKRVIEDYIVRLDERVSTKEDVLALGINNGDYVCLNTNTVFFDNGFIKSRFLDDKAQVALLMILAKNIMKSNVILNNQVDIYFTMYEEIGHGGSSIKDDLIE
ncbi:MAG: M42 family metallopeptidase, partial [Bacilli bacterium]